MPRPQKGQKTPGSGRKPGTPNKKTVELMTMLEAHSFDPGQELVYCYRQAKRIFEFRKKRGNLAGALVALDRMADIAGDVASYVYPKKKAIEHSGEIGVKTFADFIASADAEDDEEGEG